MRATRLDSISVYEERFVGEDNAPMRTAYVSFEGRAPSNSTLIYMVLDDDCVVGAHTDSSEEVIMCMEGDIVVLVDGNPVQMSAGSLLLVPAGVRHELRSSRGGLARAIGFFPNRSVATTFHVPLSSNH
ncbi:MAG: cupin domain-containing protein [Pleurocapsa minor GSE-CHR-MK-17-07R]|jgi:quercetin dioxygenase-like cupin family protein|nr:cupin domain-containing protein [Pleurocapsa minor GSE-CHR-MK 17-07R]